jgi:hypothetical protein
MVDFERNLCPFLKSSGAISSINDLKFVYRFVQLVFNCLCLTVTETETEDSQLTCPRSAQYGLASLYKAGCKIGKCARLLPFSHEKQALSRALRRCC